MFFRYIDDSFMVLSPNQAALNRPKITSTECDDNRIGESQIGPAAHVLDLNIQAHSHQGGITASSSFNTSVYRKPCDLRVILHKNSAHDYSVKFGTIF